MQGILPDSSHLLFTETLELEKISPEGRTGKLDSQKETVA
jgi:hypothetical protein